MQSLCNVRRIQELEARLNKSEGTISSLKLELKRATTELELTRKASMSFKEDANGHATSDSGNCEENILSSGSKPGSPMQLGSSALETTSSMKDIPSENGAKTTDLASIIMRSKEHDLYKNGYTQRIRALEQKPFTAKVPLGQSDNQFTGIKDEISFGKNESAKNTSTADSTAEQVIQEAENPTNSKMSETNVKFFRRVSPRKVRTRWDHMKNSKSGTCPDEQKGDQNSSGIKTSKITIGNNNGGTGETVLRAINKKISDNSVSSKNSDDRPTLPLSKGSPGLLRCNRGRVKRLSVANQIHTELENKAFSDVKSVKDGIGNEGMLETTVF